MPIKPKIICPDGLVISDDLETCKEETVPTSGFSCPTFEPGDPKATEYTLYNGNCYTEDEIISAPEKITVTDDTNGTVTTNTCPILALVSTGQYTVSDGTAANSNYPLYDVGNNTNCCPAYAVYDSSTNRCLAGTDYYDHLKTSQTEDTNYPDFFAYYRKNNSN
jgi:hypothetical protein